MPKLPLVLYFNEEGLSAFQDALTAVDEINGEGDGDTVDDMVILEKSAASADEIERLRTEQFALRCYGVFLELRAAGRV